LVGAGGKVKEPLKKPVAEGVFQELAHEKEKGSFNPGGSTKGSRAY